MRYQPPWDDPTVVEHAIGIACRVRDVTQYDPRGLLDLIPDDLVGDVLLALAAMVDVDQPLRTLKRWRQPRFHRPELSPAYCPHGHPLTRDNLVRNGFDPSGRQRLRCALCCRRRNRQPA